MRSTAHSNRESGQEVKKRVKAEGGVDGKKVSGGIFDKKVEAKVRGKVYKRIVSSVWCGTKHLGVLKSSCCFKEPLKDNSALSCWNVGGAA